MKFIIILSIFFPVLSFAKKQNSKKPQNFVVFECEGKQALLKNKEWMPVSWKFDFDLKEKTCIGNDSFFGSIELKGVNKLICTFPSLNENESKMIFKLDRYTGGVEAYLDSLESMPVGYLKCKKRELLI